MRNVLRAIAAAGTVAAVVMLTAAACDGGRADKATGAAAQAPTAGAAEKPQSLCPVMGGAVDKDLYVDAEGYRIYVCCQGCVATVKADPAKYIKKIRDNGETPQKVPQATAAKQGGE